MLTKPTQQFKQLLMRLEQMLFKHMLVERMSFIQIPLKQIPFNTT
jgi:hypothetical protein